jgi:hypothetical protein
VDGATTAALAQCLPSLRTFEEELNMTGRQYGTLGLAGVGASVLGSVALTLLEPDLSVVENTTSEYAARTSGWLALALNMVPAVGIIAIALGLRETLASGKRVTASWGLLLMAGLGFVVSGLFPTDPAGTTESTVAGTIHGTAALVTVLSFPIAAWLLRGVFARDRRWEHLARAQSWFAVLVTVAFLLQFALYPTGAVGLIQRIFLVVVATWLLFLGGKLRQVEDP